MKIQKQFSPNRIPAFPAGALLSSRLHPSWLLALTWLACWSWGATVVAAADGDLDPTFGNGGKVVTSFPGGYDIGKTVAVQADGKVIAAGGSGSDFALTRYNTDGSLDATFGMGGRVNTNFPNGQGGFRSGEQANDILIQPDGKIVLAGYASETGSSKRDFALARYDTDGALDPSFGAGGLVVTAFPNDVKLANAAALQSDGKIVVAGASGTSFVLTRYNTDGSLDAAFGTAGRLTTGIPNATSSVGANDVAIQSDGKIIAAGTNGRDFLAVRYNANGSLDDGTASDTTPGDSFGATGLVTTDFNGAFDSASAVLIQPNGMIVAVGSAGGSFALARYNADGSLDPSFDGDGKVTTNFGLFATAHAAALQPDGRIVAAGAAGTSFALARYNTDGSIDPSFDADGKVTTSFGGDQDFDGALGVALQTDGRIVATGSTNVSDHQSDFAVARYNTNGSLDSTFDGDGKVITDFPLEQDAITALLVQADDKVIAVGSTSLFPNPSNTVQNADFELARYTATGALDTTFGTGGLVKTGFTVDSDDVALAAALQADGKIVVVGQTGAFASEFFDPARDTFIALVRFNRDGSLDPSFGMGGRVMSNFGAGRYAASAVAIQPDGKIVVAGTNNNGFDGVGADGSAFIVARYNADGSPDDGTANDTTPGDLFGTNGRVTTDFNGVIAYARAVQIQADGKIVAAGTSGRASGSGTDNDFALARYNADGSLDSLFGTGGKVTTDFAGGSNPSDYLTGLVIQPDGKLVAAGSATIAGRSDFALARYNVDGSLDSSFGTGGKVTTDFNGDYDLGNSLALQSDGRIVVAGVIYTGGNVFDHSVFGLARYNADGSLDTNFATGGRLTTDFSGIISQGAAVAIEPDGRIIAGGYTDTGSSEDFALARYSTSASLLTPGLLNISTRLRVLTDDSVMIGGVIINGTTPFRVLFRAVGNSLQSNGQPFPGRLADPTLELHDSSGAIIAFNDNWGDAPEPERNEIMQSGLQPDDPREPAILRVLAPGAYTAILRGNDHTTGVAVFEAYDANLSGGPSQLANLSTRGFVDTEDNLMIGGAIIGNGGVDAVVRGLGPSLATNGVPVANRLADPTLQVVDSQGTTVAENNNWQDDPAQAQTIMAAGLAPADSAEAAIRLTLPAGPTTFLLRGANDGTGVGLFEIYDVTGAHLP